MPGDWTDRVVMASMRFARRHKWAKLLACLVVDAIGAASYLLPFLGEFADVVWAPIQFAFLQFMFGSFVVAVFGFCEELGPGTDFIPTATLAWLVQYAPFLAGWKRRLKIVEADTASEASLWEELKGLMLPGRNKRL